MGSYKEILNSEDVRFGGSGEGNPRALRSKPVHWDEEPQSIEVNIPAMSTLVFQCTPEAEGERKKETQAKKKTASSAKEADAMKHAARGKRAKAQMKKETHQKTGAKAESHAKGGGRKVKIT